MSTYTPFVVGQKVQADIEVKGYSTMRPDGRSKAFRPLPAGTVLTVEDIFTVLKSPGIPLRPEDVCYAFTAPAEDFVWYEKGQILGGNEPFHHDFFSKTQSGLPHGTVYIPETLIYVRRTIEYTVVGGHGAKATIPVGKAVMTKGVAVTKTQGTSVKLTKTAHYFIYDAVYNRVPSSWHSDPLTNIDGTHLKAV